MEFLNRRAELRRLDNALRPGAFAVIWGRRRVGKSRLLIEWARRCGGLYTVADQSAPSVQRRYLAAAIGERFPGFADVEYPDWRAFFARLGSEAASSGWGGPFILDELPYLIAADPTIVGTLQNWIDSAMPRPCTVVSGSSQHMMHGAALEAGAPLYGRAVEAFAVQPLRPGYLGDAFGTDDARELVALYALWGGMPRYWELAQGALAGGADLAEAVDSLVLDPAGPLHGEPDRLFLEETPPAIALRPLLDVIGAGAHRLSEIAGRLERPASSLSRPLTTLAAMQLVRRETPFGTSAKATKRALYRIDDPFLRFWFRVVAPHRAVHAQAPRETRIGYWQRYRTVLEAYAFEELCRMAVPALHRCDIPLAALGPWEPAQRYWRGNDPELDIVARSTDGKRLLVGEAKWLRGRSAVSRAAPAHVGRTLPFPSEREIVHAMFVPEAAVGVDAETGTHLVGAKSVMEALL